MNSRAVSSGVPPPTWTILPYDLRKIQSSYCFNIKLKTHFNLYNIFVFRYDLFKYY